MSNDEVEIVLSEEMEKEFEEMAERRLAKYSELLEKLNSDNEED